MGLDHIFQKPLNQEYQDELLRKYKETDDKSIKELIILHNLRLVKYFSNKYQKIDSPMRESDDLFQEGVIGLMEAIDTYDEERGAFSGYAALKIKGSILRYMTNKEGTIRIPAYKRQQIQTMRRVKSHLMQNLGREPTNHEIAEKLEITVAELEYLIEISADAVTLETIIGEDDMTIADMIEDESARFEDEVCEMVMIKDFLDKSLSTLEPDQRLAIKLNLGIGCRQHTLKEIANILNRTPEWVRQVKEKGLRKIRRSRYGMELYRELDESTIWYRSPQYGPKNGNSGSFDSPVERIVFERERMMERKLMKKGDE